MYNMKITDKGLKEIYKLENLTNLSLIWTQITAEWKEKIKKIFPNIIMN
jgi:hypothetical protein